MRHLPSREKLRGYRPPARGIAFEAGYHCLEIRQLRVDFY
jgi:hypothetical protein